MAALPTRVLIVGDLATFRELVRNSIQQCPEMVVVGTAKDGDGALAKAIRLEPDVIALDAQTPTRDGQNTLEAILTVRPMPIVVVGSLAAPVAECSLRALEMGALDYVAKPSGNLDAFGAELRQKLKTLARVDVWRLLENSLSRWEQPPKVAAPSLPNESRGTHCCIAIGVSTGGPPILAELFAALSPPMPPIVVVQHMPGAFTGPFAKRLDAMSDLSIREASDKAEILPNEVLIAPGGRHLRLRRYGTRVIAKLTDHEPVSGHRPSVDVMMCDAAAIYRAKCLGVIMTGMGVDGVDGCRAIQLCGGEVLGQDQATSAVYGMNRAAFAAGWVTRQFAVHDLPHLLQQRAVLLLAPPCGGVPDWENSPIRRTSPLK